jgi:Uma2 family endonuclease
MATVQQTRATLDDLYRTSEKAELIGGRIVIQMATGRKPNRVAGRIYRSLNDYTEQLKKGEAFTDNMGYAIPILPSGRESFSPDASYYDGPFPKNAMRFISGPPKFAAEVRSESDYLRIGWRESCVWMQLQRNTAASRVAMSVAARPMRWAGLAERVIDG